MKNIWSVGDEIQNDTIKENRTQFEDELSWAGASKKEIQGILGILWKNSCYYQSALEALEDYRETRN